MSDTVLNGRSIAFVATSGVDHNSFTSVWDALREAGGRPVVIAPERGFITTLESQKWESHGGYTIDMHLDEAHAEHFDALVLPGGVFSADSLRSNPAVLELVNQFAATDKPIFCIGHAALILISAGLTRGKKITSPESLSVDVNHAGAHWVDAPVVSDGFLISCRGAQEIDLLIEQMFFVLAGHDDSESALSSGIIPQVERSSEQ